MGIGTSIVTRAGPSVQLASTSPGEAQKVFNFEVEDFHTYFVGSSEAWVHNTCRFDLSGTVEDVMRRYGWDPAKGVPILIDENLPPSVAGQLAGKGFNAVSEKFGLFPRVGGGSSILDPDIIQLMNKIGGKVVTKNIADFQGKCNAIEITGGNATRNSTQVMEQLSKILGFSYP